MSDTKALLDSIFRGEPRTLISPDIANEESIREEFAQTDFVSDAKKVDLCPRVASLVIAVGPTNLKYPNKKRASR